jgi:hypothetical protein
VDPVRIADRADQPIMVELRFAEGLEENAFPALYQIRRGNKHRHQTGGEDDRARHRRRRPKGSKEKEPAGRDERTAPRYDGLPGDGYGWFSPMPGRLTLAPAYSAASRVSDWPLHARRTPIAK